MKNAQGSLEYLLLIGGAILMASSAVMVLSSVSGTYSGNLAGILENRLPDPFDEIPETPETEREMDSYSPGEIFLVTTEDWRSVLQLVPLTIWTRTEEACDSINHGTELCAYPLLVLHVESENAFDPDSVIHFMQQYPTTRLTIFGSTPAAFDDLLTAAEPIGADLADIQRLTMADYFSYWTLENSTVVLVDYDNYESGILASTYASYLNVPLVFVNSSNLSELEAVLNGKEVIVIGGIDSAVQDFLNSNASSVESFSDNSLRLHYKSITNTDKVILTNPTDLENYFDLSVYPYWDDIGKFFIPDKNPVRVNQVYQSDSMLAPILASGKQELIFTTNERSDFEAIRQEFSSEYLSVFPENTETIFTCNTDNACSLNFKEKTVERMFADGELEMDFDITDFQSEGETPYYYTFWFGGYFYNCPASGKTNLEV